MMTKAEIQSLLKAEMPKLCPGYHVELAYLFGSAVRGRFGSRSDVDVAVRFEAGLDSHTWFRLSTRLEFDLSKLVDRQLDLTILNLADALLRYEVLVNGVCLYFRDAEERALYHIRVLRDYEDYCHAQDFFIAAMRERLLGGSQ